MKNYQMIYLKLSNDIFKTFDIVQLSLFEKLHKQNWVAGERGFMGEARIYFYFYFFWGDAAT